MGIPRTLTGYRKVRDDGDLGEPDVIELLQSERCSKKSILGSGQN